MVPYAHTDRKNVPVAVPNLTPGGGGDPSKASQRGLNIHRYLSLIETMHPLRGPFRVTSGGTGFRKGWSSSEGLVFIIKQCFLSGLARLSLSSGLDLCTSAFSVVAPDWFRKAGGSRVTESNFSLESLKIMLNGDKVMTAFPAPVKEVRVETAPAEMRWTFRTYILCNNGHAQPGRHP